MAPILVHKKLMKSATPIQSGILKQGITNMEEQHKFRFLSDIDVISTFSTAIFKQPE